MKTTIRSSSPRGLPRLSPRLLGRFCALALAVTAAPFVTAPAAHAQQIELPAASPPASVMQRVGLTDITVEYASPAVKGRAIWGGLVPHDKLWRSGANAATKITFGRDVTIGTTLVPAGSYAIVSLPNKTGATFILNRELGLFAGKSYDDKLDVVRAPAGRSAIPHRERLQYSFADTTNDGTTLVLEWEKVRLTLPIRVDTKAHAGANITAAEKGAWRPLAQSARYLMETEGDLQRALPLVEHSIAIESTWYNQWIKADILSRQGKWAEARAAAQTSFDLGKDDKGFFYRADVEKALAAWKDKK